MRKTAIVTIDEPGRDHGKVFAIKEMPASQAEKWATRALLALARSGTEIPDAAAGAGFAGIALLGFKALAHTNFQDLEPLLDEMFQCVKIRPDPEKHPEMERGLVENDIEEISTRLKLRAEVFSLHTGFSIPGVNSTSSISAPTPVVQPSARMSPPRSTRSLSRVVPRSTN